ncbi:MAG: amino acid permease [Verrucomicrobiaceae bacterium]|nr:MAG: amino acid permease [Verrucomicrobiaceae bacterium]
MASAAQNSIGGSAPAKSTLPPAVAGVSLFTATCIVVANMIGTGIFTSLGFQVSAIPSGFPIMLLWLIGGVCALCGALAYGELAATFPRSGGEYHFLSVIFHPAVRLLCGSNNILHRPCEIHERR